MRHRNLPSAEGSGSGPAGRISKMRKLVTALIRHERIEGKHPWLDESRGYAERLIEEAIRNGDQHKPTMEKADYWLNDKDLIHKLFKVLVPRYKETKQSYTQMWNLPTEYPGPGYKMVVLELRNNPWPDVVQHQRVKQNTLINVLLRAAESNYQAQKSKQLSSAAVAGQTDTTSSEGVTAPEQADETVSQTDAASELANLVDGTANVAEATSDQAETSTSQSDPTSDKTPHPSDKPSSHIGSSDGIADDKRVNTMNDSVDNIVHPDSTEHADEKK